MNRTGTVNGYNKGVDEVVAYAENEIKAANYMYNMGCMTDKEYAAAMAVVWSSAYGRLLVLDNSGIN